jgi:site-specific DNA-methyltransferase (adenine-specific)
MHAPIYDKWGIQVFEADCLDVMRGMPDNSVHAIITDPPAGVSFMSKSWDSNRGGRDRWVEWLAERMTEAMRVLKPGGHAIVWSLPRTSHWTAWALEDAGFEIRDCVIHLFGQGFCKGRNIYQLDILPEVERQLREQGIEGDIEWR